MPHTIALDDTILQKLTQFKRIYDVIVDCEHDFDIFVNTVLTIGLDKMKRDVIPEDMEWTTIEVAFSKDHKFMCDLIAEILTKGNEVTDEQKEKMKRTIERYIS